MRVSADCFLQPATIREKLQVFGPIVSVETDDGSGFSTSARCFSASTHIACFVCVISAFFVQFAAETSVAFAVQSAKRSSIAVGDYVLRIEPTRPPTPIPAEVDEQGNPISFVGQPVALDHSQRGRDESKSGESKQPDDAHEVCVRINPLFQRVRLQSWTCTNQFCGYLNPPENTACESCLLERHSDIASAAGKSTAWKGEVRHADVSTSREEPAAGSFVLSGKLDWKNAPLPPNRVFVSAKSKAKDKSEQPSVAQVPVRESEAHKDSDRGPATPPFQPFNFSFDASQSGSLQPVRCPALTRLAFGRSIEWSQRCAYRASRRAARCAAPLRVA